MNFVSKSFIFLVFHFLFENAVAQSGNMTGGYVNEEPLLFDKFPDDFQWGVATASYQVKPNENRLLFP